MKILLAVDGSQYTKRMLGYLAAHDELLNKSNTFTLVTVVPPLTNHVRQYLDAQTVSDHYRERAEDVLSTVKSFVDMQGWPVESVHLVGHPAEAVAHYATEHRFDLLVMGTHGHTALVNVLLGSVVTGVLARCAVPVLLVR
jgi:nucleotide-binding universal stress UspA family protein